MQSAVWAVRALTFDAYRSRPYIRKLFDGDLHAAWPEQSERGRIRCIHGTPLDLCRQAAELRPMIFPLTATRNATQVATWFFNPFELETIDRKIDRYSP